MPGPFPGMDPYLERPDRWPNFHTVYLVGIQRALRAVLPAGFVARTEERVYIASSDREVRPDVSVFATAPAARPIVTASAMPTAVLDRTDEPEIIEGAEDRAVERYLQVLDVRDGRREAVTVLEVLSPANKAAGSDGFREYRRKQREVRASGLNLLEIDLLRAGAYTLYPREEAVAAFGPWEYLVSLFDASRPRDYLFWRLSVRQALPAVRLPLTEGVAPVRLDLQAVLNTCYDESGLGDDIDYRQSPEPPLRGEDATWADELLRRAGLRS